MDSLGQFLRQQREHKGYSLEDAQEETKIQVKYLKALEEENFDILPGEVFTKGFIRSYADFLGLDSQDVMKKYYASRGTNQEEQIENKEPVKLAKDQEEQEKNAKEGEATAKTKIFPVVALLTIATIALGIWVYNLYTPTPREQTPPPQAIEQPENIQPQEPAPEPQRPVDLPAPVYVRTAITKNCWTQVRIDGKLVFEGMLFPDTVREWQGQQQITFRFGNAGGVNLEYNGQDLGKVGADGEVVDKTFTPNQ